MYLFPHEHKNIEKTPAVYSTTSPIIKLLESYEEHYEDWHQSYYYTMFILNQNGALYVHKDNPNLNIIEDIHTRVENPQLILTGILDFFLDNGDLSLYVLTY